MSYIPYEPLFDIISFEGFQFGNPLDGEERLLTPQLQKKGYTNIEFDDNHDGYFTGNVRICRCIDSDGNPHRYYYG